MRLKSFLKIFFLAFKEFVQDRAEGLAAALAYFQLLSIPPLVALMVLLSNFIFGEARAKAEIYPVIADFFHPEFIQAIKYMIEYSFKMDETKFISITFLAIVTLIHGTLSYFEQMKDCIETFWDVRREKFGIKVKLAKKADALLMASVVFILLMSGFLLRYWVFHPRIEILLLSGNLFIETVIIFLIVTFFLIYCPPSKITFREVFPGAVITTLLYMLGRMGLRYFLGKNHSEAAEVSAVLLMYLLWCYYSSLIFLYGVEFSRIYIDQKRKLIH